MEDDDYKSAINALNNLEPCLLQAEYEDKLTEVLVNIIKANKLAKVLDSDNDDEGEDESVEDVSDDESDDESVKGEPETKYEPLNVDVKTEIQFELVSSGYECENVELSGADHGYTPLIWCVRNHLNDLAMKILQNCTPEECNLSHNGDYGTALINMIRSHTSINVVREVLKHPNDCGLNEVYDGMTALQSAIRQTSEHPDYGSEIVLKILENPDQCNLYHQDTSCWDEKYTALIEAINRGMKPIVDRILDIYDKTKLGDLCDGRTILSHACNHTDEDICMRLLNEFYEFIDPYHVESSGDSAFLWACYNYHTEVMVKLMEHPEKINFNDPDEDGNIPLSVIVREESEVSDELTMDILKYTDPELILKRNDDGESPFDQVLCNNDKVMRDEMIKILKENGMFLPDIVKGITINEMIDFFGPEKVIDHIKHNPNIYKVSDVVKLLDVQKLTVNIKGLDEYIAKHRKIQKECSCMYCYEDSERWIMFSSCSHVVCVCEECQDLIKKSCPICTTKTGYRNVFVVS